MEGFSGIVCGKYDVMSPILHFTSLQLASLLFGRSDPYSRLPGVAHRRAPASGVKQKTYLESYVSLVEKVIEGFNRLKW